MQLLNAATNTNANVSIMMNIEMSDAEGIGNICADTPSGDKTKTILIGAHSDGVQAGSGINDNAGPNYRFGIHDSATAPASTPKVALHGTSRITDLFRQWFTEQKLPWSNASFNGGSDYAPFLANGLAVGGVNTGAGGIKSPHERDQYSAMLGTGNGGIANAAYDPCYHQQCDRIRNINPFAYEKVVKSAAYAIEYMGRLNNLEKWLYPEGRPKQLEPFNRNQLYNTQSDPRLY
ncbi:unnamed protein product [Rotaria sordida]|uniref:Peptidase M28 domain-containing protein n=1 Tax=Rotaria sordida TaxID=392033 RepID=A0A819QVQ3_9BILA|nr:unnamed protein product [Rotaria sordida]